MHAVSVSIPRTNDQITRIRVGRDQTVFRTARGSAGVTPGQKAQDRQLPGEDYPIPCSGVALGRSRGRARNPLLYPFPSDVGLG